MHGKTFPGAFYFNYFVILSFLFVLHFIISKHAMKPIRQVIGVIALTIMGAAFQQPAFDAAWREPSTREEQENMYKDVVF